MLFRCHIGCVHAQQQLCPSYSARVMLLVPKHHPRLSPACCMFVDACLLRLCGRPEQAQEGARGPPPCLLCPDRKAVSNPGLPLGFAQFAATFYHEFHLYPPELCTFGLNFTQCHELNCPERFRCVYTYLDGPWWLINGCSGAAACPANLCLVTLKHCGALSASILVHHRTIIRSIKHLHLVG